MQVFKCFFLIVRRNIGMVLLYTGIFIFMTLMVTANTPGAAAGRFEESKIPVTVIDRDGGALAAALRDYLYARQQAAPLPDDGEAIRDALYSRQSEYVLVIPAGYEAALLRGEAPVLHSEGVPESYSAQYVNTQVDSFVQTVRAYTGAGFPLAQALRAAPEDLALQPEAVLESGAPKTRQPVFYFYQYLCYGLAMVTIFGLSPALLAFGRKDTRARISASALSLKRRNLELVLAALVLGASTFAVFITLALLLYRGDALAPAGLLCAANAFVFLLFCIALALFIGQVSRNTNTISAIANVAVMGMCFLGGVYVPGHLLSARTRTIGYFMPASWYMQVVNAAANAAPGAGIPWAAVWEGMGMQLVFAAALLAAALVVSRQKQRIG